LTRRSVVRATGPLGGVVAVAGVAAVLVGSGAPQAAAPPARTTPAPTGPPIQVSPSAFALTDARVSPRRAYFAGREVTITFGIAAAAPLALQVDLVREPSSRVVRRYVLPAVAPGIAQLLRWDGLTGGGEVAPGGSYRVRVAVAGGGEAHLAGRVTLRGHIYPIRGPHADRGPIGTFGVGRSGGRIHNGFDVNAACGTKVVAARGGRVVRAGYDPVLYGNIIIVRGERTQRDYWYSHLRRPSRLRAGDRVRTGEQIGTIGATGNARTIGCHLHFEIRARGVPIDPAPELHAWDAWS
jgi:murein DD-endopeptidase MepM/ murein hydrolase activator NlpD